MLETPEERVELLKAGIIGKHIEEIYITGNNFKILNHPVLFELESNEIENSPEKSR